MKPWFYIAFLLTIVCLSLFLVISNIRLNDTLISLKPSVVAKTQYHYPPFDDLNGEIAINYTDATTLDSLPGVGLTTAEKIITERNENGIFYFKEDLLQVPGIGNNKLSSILPYITLKMIGR